MCVFHKICSLALLLLEESLLKCPQELPMVTNIPDTSQTHSIFIIKPCMHLQQKIDLCVALLKAYSSIEKVVWPDNIDWSHIVVRGADLAVKMTVHIATGRLSD